MTGVPVPAEVDVVVDLLPRPGCAAELADTVARNSRAIVARSPECLALTLQPGPDGGQTVVLRWASERALEDFAASAANAEYVESLIGLVSEPPRTRLLRPRLSEAAPARPDTPAATA